MAEEIKAPGELSQLDKLQNWYEENDKIVNIVSAVVLVVLLILIAYKFYFQPKNEMAAQDAIFKAQTWLEQDSISKALNDPMNGFLVVADDFGGTKAGNLAKYSAGLCYMELGDYVNAEKYLAKFNPKGDVVLGGLAIATLADAQMENKNESAALSNYKKAANFSSNEASSPFLLLKAGIAHSYVGKNKEALTFFNQLKEEYPSSSEAQEADKFIGKANAAL